MWPQSIREINKLPEEEKLNLYKTLLPDWLFSDFGIESSHNGVLSAQQPLITFRCPDGSRALEIIVKRRITDLDPMLYLNMADTFNNQLIVLLVVVNDPDSKRFNVDVDQQGNQTQFGTLTRNLPAEREAISEGLAPGQIRKGLRKFRDSVPLFEKFVRNMGHDMFFIEPLAYHNAIIFESYGFQYLHGQKEMERINAEFQPGGELHNKLTVDNPFRLPDGWLTIRKRSWAIHDGILGHPYTGFQMYKYIDKHAGVDTFPNAIW